ncbi:GDSL-type esterase/lipase family protein [Actinoplanes siamensis]|nr:GDSL-type esterase/lipase family protein [Actinoplanes siamensis]
MPRRWHLVVLSLLAVLALACEGGAGAADPEATKPRTRPPAQGYPSSMAALGDSITAGVGSCLAYLACSRNSWSTGADGDVESHYRRILAKNSKIKGNVHNFAVPGAEADGLAAQATRAVEAKVAYVTVLIGANDACAPSAGAMTSVPAFRAAVDRGLARLRRGLPKARVLVVSIPDLYRLWRVGRDDAEVVRAWNAGKICQSMLADPTSTAGAAEKRRRAVRDRIDAYDGELREACEAYGSRCRWDGGRVHDVRFDLDLVNTFDFFHPNLKGQNALAEATYPDRFTW